MRPSVRPLAAAAAAALAAVAPLAVARPAGAQVASPQAPAPPPPDSARAAARDTLRHAGPAPGAPHAAADDDAQALAARLDSVDAAARGGLASLPAAAAVPLIERIRARLQSSDRSALRSIADDLGDLRAELGGATVDGRRVGTILARVGPKVSVVARTQSGPMRAALQSIGAQLTAAGRQLVPRAAPPSNG
jgi:hypothetical protein